MFLKKIVNTFKIQERKFKSSEDFQSFDMFKLSSLNKTNMGNKRAQLENVSLSKVYKASDIKRVLALGCM